MFSIAVLVSGRGSNLEAMIKAEKDGFLKAKISIVISDNPKAKALDKAKEHKIPCRVLDPTLFESKVEFNQNLINLFRQYRVQLVVLAGYMRLLTPSVIEAFPNQIINIHPSLLPAFPGLDAQKQALNYGVKYSGCTVHFVDGGMDTGSIIAQRVVPVYDTDNLEELTNRILKEEHSLYPQVINWLAEGRVIKLTGRKVIVQGEEKY